MADGQQNRFPGVRSFAHLGGAGGHTRGWEGRRVSTEGWEGDGLYRGAERGRGLSGVTFHAHLETQMADGQQNRFQGVRSFAHLGGAGGHTRGEKGGGLYRGVGRAVGYTEGWEGRWAYTEGREGRWAIQRGEKGDGPLQREGCSTGPQVRGEAVLKSLWKNLERGGIKWKNIPNFVTKRERR